MHSADYWCIALAYRWSWAFKKLIKAVCILSPYIFCQDTTGDANLYSVFLYSCMQFVFILILVLLQYMQTLCLLLRIRFISNIVVTQSKSQMTLQECNCMNYSTLNECCQSSAMTICNTQTELAVTVTCQRNASQINLRSQSI